MNFIFHSIDSNSSYEDVSEAQFINFCGKLRDSSNPSTSYLITFDDGNKSDLIGYDIAKFYGIDTAHFIITQYIGEARYLNATDLRYLASNGATIGSHTHSHKALIGNAKEIWTDEIQNSLSILEEILGKKTTSLSVPYGLYYRSMLRYLWRKTDLNIYSSDPERVAPKGVISRFGINSRNVELHPSRLAKYHCSYNRALIFGLKNQFIKSFGDKEYKSLRKFVSKYIMQRLMKLH